MSVQPAGGTGGRTTSRVLASAPWIVVLSGVALLVVLLVTALLSFRGSERQAVPPPAPPMLLPTVDAAVPATGSPTAVATPTTVATPTATPTRTQSATPSSPDPAVPSPRVMAGGQTTGQVTARYAVTASDRDSFEADLVVRNGTGQARDWRVELLFTGNVKSIRVSGASGVSVSTNGSGWYVLRSTRSLGAGETASVHLRFTRNGAGEEPGQCTVNGADCVIG
ncbi:cellulose binding domain-containing protein [Micromonospora thermarum]|uniref:CBM2 domain-containing protein n=1 Tax=Micromonospora thermarum TaxID=2720024 RepID=A0ABX0Z7V0_9ACTN|nr:cellulose binding domain-containing protein [Micromonospora thermarum]NJP32479.1 hypothetical protein [Micromonospora thermarum]